MFSGSVVGLLLLALRFAFILMRANAQAERAVHLRTWDQRPDPKHRARRRGVIVEVALRRPHEDGPATSAAVRARWAFGAGPVFAVSLVDSESIEAGYGTVRSFAGANDEYAVTSDGASVVARLFSPAVLRGFGALPSNTVLRATKERVELVMHANHVDDASITQASKLVAEVAAFGMEVLRARIEPIEGAKVVVPTEKVPAHALVPTRAGLANLDFDLGPDGLTGATLVVETEATSVHAADLDAAGVIVGGNASWLEHLPAHARREIGPARVTIEDGWVELTWKELPTSDQISRAAELLGTLAAGAGSAYR